MSTPEAYTEIADTLPFLDDWEERYGFIIELGKQLPPLAEHERSDANKVRGCASQVWLVSEVAPSDSGPVITLRCESDAMIVQGLVAVLIALYSGRPADEIAATDALAAFDWLAEREQHIAIWGRSLGASPAVWVASQRQADALLLETPFYSAVNVAAERYPFIPVAWLMLDQFRSNDWIGAVEEPVFVAHGTADQTVSVGNGERLFEEVPNPYDLWIEEGADHSDLWARGIWERAQAFFSEVEQGG